MRKTGHRARREELSAGRIEYIEAARQRLRSRRIRRTMLLVALVAAAVIYLTGLVNTSVMLLEDMADTVRIALMPEQGFPQQTGAGVVYQAETLGGSFVVLGEEGCTVFSNGGGRLNTVGTGYARPALAAGGNSFVLYNRSGSELRVESRTRELYTRQTEGHIYLCALSDRGELAVVTDDVRKLALLTVYDANRNELLTWSTTTAEGVPLRMDFSPDGTQLAIAAVTAQDGQMVTNLYLLNLRAGEPQLLASEPGSTPLALTWCSNDRLLAVCDTHAALYGSDGSAQGRYDFGGQDVAALSAEGGGLAVLFGSGPSSTALLLDGGLGVQYTGPVPNAHGIVRGNGAFYLLCESSVECYGLDGAYQWSYPLDARPQALLAGEDLFVFAGNLVQRIVPPQPEEAGSGGTLAL
ncbi:MAG TPA: protein TolB [Candidatus Faecalibacterium gallistercoris]|uniref:Protein TolB n=1 Tax=Candidatus Faecalibacterium gallistercoris TaxID=2838579 RepID=A0A9D2FEU1_9FIRM|nr:protein TolB [Candidatus Faecalibacterium gallistercoris]